VFVGRAKVVAVHVVSDAAALAGARFLIKAEMNASIDARVVDIRSDLTPVFQQ
jgi:hypothetical protein